MAGTVPVFGKAAHITIVNSHPATKKVNFTRRAVPWYMDPTKLSDAQLDACISLGEFAYHNCYGKYGTVTLPDGRRISVPAYIVMTKYPKKGVGAFGGKSYEERASERHERSRARLDYLKKIKETRRGKTPAAAPEVLAALK